MLATKHALNQYRQSGINSGISYADPHQLVCMLYDSLRERLALAKGAIQHNNNAGKGESLGRAIEIVGYLQACLDLEHGGEIASNLDALYDYMTRRLFDATAKSDVDAIDEVVSLVINISSAWKAIHEHQELSLDNSAAG